MGMGGVPAVAVEDRRKEIALIRTALVKHR
jgi:hypothetical protein